MTTRDPKKLRLILAYSLTMLAGVLVLRGFDTGEDSHRAVGVHVDSTLNNASVRRHYVVGLPDLTSRLENLRLTKASTYGDTGRNIFEVEVQPSHEPAVAPHKFLEQKSPPPVVPTSLPLTLFGFSRSGETRSIFLLKENDVFIAREGDIVDRRYKIARIAQNSAQVKDMLSNQQQELWFKETP